MKEAYRANPLKAWTGALLHGLLLFFLILFALFALMPMLLAIGNSFKPWSGFMRVPPEFIPSTPTLDNYKYFFMKEFITIEGRHEMSIWAQRVPRWALNTLIVATTVTAGNLFLGTLTGYAFAKMRAPGREFLFWLNMAMLVFPTIFNMASIFHMLRAWDWMNTYQGLIIPILGGNMFLARQFMKRLPSTLIDSARMDGSSEFKIYRRVILPLSKPLIAVLAVFTFTGQWKDFLWPLIVTNTPEMRTLQLGLALMVWETYENMGITIAGSILISIPIVIVFFLAQKYFVTGLTVGALKG